jgi:RNA polymerase sigma-70 factor, ECF subfamily
MTDRFRRELTELLPRLRRFALALTCDATEADDLVQAGCEKALRSSSQWQPGTRLDSWMYRIMQNHWIDHTRSRASRGPAVEPEVLDALPDEDFDRRMEARLTLERVTEVMRALPDTMRSVLALVTVEGLSYQEAATVLNVPVGTVMSRLARARIELMRRLNAAEEVSHA